MRLIETTEKYVTNTEETAKEIMEKFRAEADEKGYSLKKSGYEHKVKKSKGEIIDECWVVTLVMTFGEIWEEA